MREGFNRIKPILEERGKSQLWLCEKINKSFPQVNGYLNNRYQPSLPLLFDIARSLGVRPSELINDNFNGKQNT